MKTERDYLYLAVEKTGCIIMVRQFDSPEKVRRSRMVYISDNAGILGLNVNTIKNGYRLPEDYIHPEDREPFADAMRRAFMTVNDFSYELRVIGDDGVLRKINMDVIFLRSQKDDFMVEYICREIENFVPVPTDSRGQKISSNSEVKLTRDFIADNGINGYFDNFAASCELYSAILDMNGKVLAEPSGPKSYFGEFYNYLENPENEAFFQKIKNSVVQDVGPVFMEMEDGKVGESFQERRLAAAPIVIDGICCGIWILYAHNNNQAKKLFKVYRNQWTIAKNLSDHLSRLYDWSKSIDVDTRERDELDFEIKEKKIVNSMLSDLEDGSLDLEKYMEKAGKLLGVDFVVYYEYDDSNREVMHLRQFWSKRGKDSIGKQPFEWNHDHYSEEFQNRIKDGGLLIDRNTMTNKMRVEVFEGNARAIMVFPVKKDKDYFGRLIFIENTRERVWSEAETGFAREMARLVSKSIAIEEENISSGDGLDIPCSTFEALDLAVYVRDDEDGTIVYANTVLKNRFPGGDLVGLDSYRIVPRMTNEVSILSDNPDTVVEKKAYSRFTRYIEVMGGIFNVTEIYFKTRSDRQMVAVILHPAAN